MISIVDFAWFAPPLVIGAGAWVAILLSERSLEADRLRELQRGPAE